MTSAVFAKFTLCLKTKKLRAREFFSLCLHLRISKERKYCTFLGFLKSRFRKGNLLHYKARNLLKKLNQLITSQITLSKCLPNDLMIAISNKNICVTFYKNLVSIF